MAKYYEWDSGVPAYTAEEWANISNPEIPVRKTQGGYQVEPETPRKDMSDNDYFESPREMWKPEVRDYLSDAVDERMKRQIEVWGTGKGAGTRRNPRELEEIVIEGQAPTKQLAQPNTTSTRFSNRNRNRKKTTTKRASKPIDYTNPYGANRPKYERPYKPSTSQPKRASNNTTDYSNYYGPDRDKYKREFYSSKTRGEMNMIQHRYNQEREKAEEIYRKNKLAYKKGNKYYNLPNDVNYKDWMTYEGALNNRNSISSVTRFLSKNAARDIERKYGLDKLNTYRKAITAARKRGQPSYL